MKKILLILGGTILLIATIVTIWAISISNREIKIRIREVAQQEVCQSYFDKMWKTLQQKANVADQYKDAFKEIYIPLIEGRYSKGDGSLMKWITEHNPSFDVSLYKDLMESIEAERDGFFFEQSKLIDIDREHKTMRKTFPNKLVIGSRPDVKIKIIKSLKTENVYQSGQENDIDLFSKK